MKRAAFLAAGAALAACGPSNVPVYAPAPPSTTTQVGIDVHFLTGRDADLARIAGWGAQLVRTDFVPAYGTATFDTFVASVVAVGMAPLLITPYNFTAGPNLAPSEYAAQMGAAAAHFAATFPALPIAWEVMNEPDVSNGGSVVYTAATYAPYLLKTAAAIRAAAPHHVILTGGTDGGTVGSDLTFHRALAPMLGAGVVDGVSIHPYGVDPIALPGLVDELFTIYGARFAINVTEYGSPDAAGMLAMLRAARGRVPRFVAYVYQETAGQPLTYEFVAQPAAAAPAIDPPLTAAEPVLAGFLAFTGGHD